MLSPCYLFFSDDLSTLHETAQSTCNNNNSLQIKSEDTDMPIDGGFHQSAAAHQLSSSLNLPTINRNTAATLSSSGGGGGSASTPTDGGINSSNNNSSCQQQQHSQQQLPTPVLSNKGGGGGGGGGGSMEYMQTQNHIFVFSTILANKSAEAVINRQFPSIIAYHCAQPGSKKFLEVRTYLFTYT